MSACPMFPLSSETTILLKLFLKTFRIIIIEDNWTVNSKNKDRNMHSWKWEHFTKNSWSLWHWSHALLPLPIQLTMTEAPRRMGAARKVRLHHSLPYSHDVRVPPGEAAQRVGSPPSHQLQASRAQFPAGVAECWGPLMDRNRVVRSRR